MVTINSSNQEYSNNADGWELAGGSIKRKLTITNGDVAITGGANTLTLAGNFTTAGAYAITLTASATTSVNLPLSGTLATIGNTETLTNKRIVKRVSTASSSATPTINTDTTDMYILTALAANITSFTTNLSGTPINGQTLWIAITGTATRTIAWGTSFEASTVALPTTTSGTSRLDIGFVWNAATSKWRCVAVA